MNQFNFQAECITRANVRDFCKPNEDAIIADVKNGIYILLDGVTRPHGEYKADCSTSAAKQASEIFANTVYEYLSENINEVNKENLLRAAAQKANQKLLNLRNEKNLEEWGFYPGTLGIIAIIDHGVLHYLSVGDCLGVVLRGSSKMLFGKEFSLDALDLLRPNKTERYEKYCNHPDNPLSYNIYNGDIQSAKNAEYAFINLEKGDTLLLTTDGISDIIKYEKTGTLKQLALEELISLSAKYDIPPFGNYADDKSIIRIFAQ